MAATTIELTINIITSPRREAFGYPFGHMLYIQAATFILPNCPKLL